MRVEDAKFNPSLMGKYASTIMWTVDFIYALEDRPKIFKWLFKVAIGKYAWREFCGAVKSMIETGTYTPNIIGYSLQDMDYHQEKPELWGMK